MNIYKNLFVLFFTLVVFSGCAGTKIMSVPQQWSSISQEKSFLKKMRFSSGAGHIKRLRQNNSEVPHLKRVGIIAFSLYSPSAGETTTYSSHIRTTTMSDEGKEFFVNMLYTPALPEMKKSFLEQGVQLLTPEEYLDTPEKQKKYQEMKFKNSTMWKAVTALSRRLAGAPVGTIKAQPDGLKYILLSVEDAKIWRAVGGFAGELGLDALLIMETTVNFDSVNLDLRKISASLVGPNSVPFREEDKNYYAPFGPVKGYLQGINYGNLSGTSPMGAVLLATLQNNKLDKAYFSGMGNIYGRITKALLNKTQAAFEGIKIKK